MVWLQVGLPSEGGADVVTDRVMAAGLEGYVKTAGEPGSFSNTGMADGSQH